MSTSDTRTFDVPTAIKTALSSELQAVAHTQAQWHTMTATTLAEVERLLTRAEGEGFHEHELTVLRPDVYVVCWR